MTRKILLSLFSLFLLGSFLVPRASIDARISVTSTSHTPFYNALGPNNTLYVAGYDCGCLDTFDITDKEHPILLSSTSTYIYPGSIFVNNNYVSVGTGFGFLHTYDMSDPVHPILTSTQYVGTPLGINFGMANKMRSANGYVFMPFAQDGNVGPGGVIIFDLSNPAVPTATSTIFFDAAESGGGDVLINGNDMYATDYFGFGLRHYDISDIHNPILIQEITDIHDPLDYKAQIEGDRAFEPWGLASKGNALYLLDDNIMRVYDISSSTNMVYASTTVAFKDVEGFGIRDNVMYFSASFDHLIAYYDVSDELNPRFLAYTSTGAEGSDLSNLFVGSNNYWLSFDPDGYYYVNDTGFDTVSVYEPLRLIPSVLSLNLIKNSTVHLDLSLPVQPTSDVTVTFATTTDGTEPCVTTSPDSIVFTPANWRTQQSLTIRSITGEGACDVGTIIFTQPLLSSADAYYNSKLVGKVKTTIVGAFASSRFSLWNLGPTWGNPNSIIPGIDYPASTSDAVINTTVTANRDEAVRDITVNQYGILISESPFTLSVFGTLVNHGSIRGDIAYMNETGSYSDTLSNGLVTKKPIRKYIEETVTTKNFTTESSRDDWIIVAQGVNVDIQGATYDVSKNLFKALNNGYFTYGANPGGKVVPDVVINSPAQDDALIQWTPSVTWDDSTLCEYSFDNFTTTHTVDCSKNGSDIAKPSSAGTLTLYVRGANEHGSLTERNNTFDYDNTVPVPTTCGSDILDEASRPYYYLTGNVVGDCRATVNTELRGTAEGDESVVGYTLDGNFIATSSTQGLTISLKNIAITGSIFANGQNSSGAAFRGGSITIATSTTGDIFANGGNGNTNGGDGGVVIATYSTGVASSTIISASGGNATVCGRGGNGGSVSLINSTYGNIGINPGNDQTAIGFGLCQAVPSGTSGSGGSRIIVGLYAPPTTNTPPVIQQITQPENTTPTPSAGSGGGSVIALVNNNVTIPTGLATSTAFVAPVESKTLPASITASIKQIVQGTTEVVNSPASKAVQTVGFFAGLAGAVSLYTNALFATPLLASEVLLIPIRLWGLFLMGFGLKRRTPPWGTVYDSVTKQPIDPAFVTVKDESGKVVAESITDIDGRYGFLLPDGKYFISAAKTNYEFPSKKLIGKPADEMYRDLYFGEPITITSGQVIDKNIPLDQKNFDWNEEAKRNQDVMVFHKKNDKLFRKIGNYVFKIGSLISIVSVILNPSTYNIVILLVYVLISVLSHYGVKGKKLGFIRDRNTGQPFSFAIFRVTAQDHQTVLRSGVCDAQGRYYCIVPKGEYYVDVEKKNPDGTYTNIYQSSLIPTKNGIINKDFAI